MTNGFDSCFSEMADPRAQGLKRHDLFEIMTIALCKVLSGGQTAVNMAIFAEAKQQFLSKFLRLTNGVPSHDTFSRVFRRLDPNQFRSCFQKFMARFGEACTGVIAIDGKTIRRAIGPGCARSTLHMVSAWSCDKRQVLARIATKTKRGENAAVLKLLGFLRLKGSIVTTDALNCQRDIARQIVEKEGHYALALKANYRALYADVSRLFEEVSDGAVDQYSTVDDDHGRVETRAALVSTKTKGLQDRHEWPGLAAVGKVVRRRDTTAGATSETAYCLLSAALSSKRLGEVVRSHWGVENQLHWVLNAVMNEDQLRNRDDNTAYNLAILRHMALNLIQRDRSQVSLRSKFNLAGWNDDFLAKLLTAA
jgi:predicted transposase YbfD/YdcC